MGTVIKNYNSVGEITGYIDDAIKIIEKVKLDVTSSYNVIPTPIRNKMGSYYSNLEDLYSNILQKLNYASDGIVINVNNYKSFEEEYNNQPLEEVTIDSISVDNQFFWGYLSKNGSIPERVQPSYFENLAKNGVGTWDSENNKYILYDSKTNTNYEYFAKTGKLNINDGSNKLWIAVGYYKPAGVTDLSSCNTVTFLHGDGMEQDSYGYVLEGRDSGKKCIDSVVYNKTNALVIVPQSPNNEHNNALIDVKNEVVHTTRFAQSFMQQKESCENNIIGVSSGGITAAEIASNEGKNVYDKVVIVNGYANFDRIKDNINNLKNKELIILSANNDSLKEKLSKSLEIMNNNGFSNVQVVTSDSEIAEQAKSYEFNTVYRNDSDWKEHKSMWYSIKNSGIMEYLGG